MMPELSAATVAGANRPMIGPTPDWALWAMAGLLAFLMLLSVLNRYRAACPRRRRSAPVSTGNDNCLYMERVEVPNTELTT